MGPADYERFPGYWDDPLLRKWNLWSYVDVQDVAQSVERALEADIGGAETFIVAAADTVMKRPTLELMAEVYPDVPVRGELAEHGSLLATDKARRLLGYTPQVSWRTLLA
jgi:nucleoside-diphosphate-sugar epimerase